jgi:cell division protein FtsW (lipid II flippase)
MTVWKQTEASSKKFTKKRNLEGDIHILFLTLVLSVFGILAIYSASNYVAKTQYGDAWYFVKKQLIGFVLGMLAMVLCCRLNPVILKGKRLRWVALVVILSSSLRIGIKSNKKFSTSR